MPSAVPQEAVTPERLAKLEENQELIEAKLNDQYQTKIESGSKYRLRLSGVVLLNLYDNRGLVDNQDYPQLAVPPASDPLYASPSSFGGSLRQSQFRLQAFGPDIAGAKTSADVEFDFAGGFPSVPERGSDGTGPRLRTGTMRLDWANTSLVGGQDRLFFAPLTPTSIATLATPHYSYAGNLWAWTPQVRVEHRFALSDSSDLSIQGGILDSLTGDIPSEDYGRYPSWGEESGQPVYATRIAWSHRAFGQNLTVGAGGYYGRQDWGFNRNFDGWGGTADVTAPVRKTIRVYRRILQRPGARRVLAAASASRYCSTVRSSIQLRLFGAWIPWAGWAQLKFKLRPNFEINGALGMDNPFASELRQYNANSIYDDTFTRNLSPHGEFHLSDAVGRADLNGVSLDENFRSRQRFQSRQPHQSESGVSILMRPPRSSRGMRECGQPGVGVFVVLRFAQSNDAGARYWYRCEVVSSRGREEARIGEAEAVTLRMWWSGLSPIGPAPGPVPAAPPAGLHAANRAIQQEL